MTPYAISDLAKVPHFAETIASRGWHAWWSNGPTTLDQYLAGLTPMLSGTDIPRALVAYHGAIYLGSVLLIDNDLEARPDLSPWIAALWVDGIYRGRGIGADLVLEARKLVSKLGHDTVYLSARPEMRTYYLKRGSKLIGRDVDGLDVFSIACVWRRSLPLPQNLAPCFPRANTLYAFPRIHSHSRATGE